MRHSKWIMQSKACYYFCQQEHLNSIWHDWSYVILNLYLYDSPYFPGTYVEKIQISQIRFSFMYIINIFIHMTHKVFLISSESEPTFSLQFAFSLLLWNSNSSEYCLSHFFTYGALVYVNELKCFNCTI